MGGLLGGIGKAIMGGIGQMAGAGGGGGDGGDGGGDGGGGGDVGGIMKSVGDMVTGIIDATKNKGDAKEADAKEAPPADGKKDPLVQLQAALDKAQTPEEIDQLVAKLGEKLSKNGDPTIQKTVQIMAQQAKLELAAATI